MKTKIFIIVFFLILSSSKLFCQGWMTNDQSWTQNNSTYCNYWYQDKVPQNVLDGDVVNTWWQTAGVYPVWIIFNFGSIKTLSQFRIYIKNGMVVKDCEFQYSNSLSGPWTPAISYTCPNPTQLQVWMNLPSFTPTAAQYWRFYIISRRSSYVILPEVGFYEDCSTLTTPIAGNNGPVCVGSSLSLTAATVTGATYSWTGPNGFASSSQNPTVSSSATTAMTGTYNVTATVNDCTSSAGTTSVTVNPIPTAPIVGNNGPVCTGSALSLTASTIIGANYLWTGPNGFTSTSQNPSVSSSVTTAMAGTYIITATVNNCTSPPDTTIVIVNPMPTAPTNTTLPYNQTICTGNISALSASGVGTLGWYDAAKGGNYLGKGNNYTTPVLTAVTVFYVQDSIACGASATRTAIAVTVQQSCRTLNLKVFLEGFYSGSGIMNVAHNSSFNPKWSANITDTISIELHHAVNYSNLIYSFYGVNLYTDGAVSIPVPLAYNGSYYITVIHRNHLKTISANPVSFTGTSTSYDFTDNINKAFASIQKNINSVAVMYAGELTSVGHAYPNLGVHDDVIDISDVYYIFNSYLNGDFGYLIGDVSGDGTVDLTDVYLCFNNYLSGVYAKTP